MSEIHVESSKRTIQRLFDAQISERVIFRVDHHRALPVSRLAIYTVATNENSLSRLPGPLE